jgi:multiple sugar transport system permease protein
MSVSADRAQVARRTPRRPEQQVYSLSVRMYGLPRGTVTVVTAICVLFSIFTLAPIAWIVIASTKTQANIVQSFGFWFAPPFELIHNFTLLFQDVDGLGVYVDWMGNTVLYAVLGGVGATLLSALAGYGFARFRFRGSRSTLYLVLATLLVPLTAITLPLYLVYAKLDLVNTVAGMVLPSLVSPVGTYLMYNFIRVSVPPELLDAARVEGAGEVRIFISIALPLMVPGLMTVLLFSIVGVWNNYFLPLIIFSRSSLYPLTVGLGNWFQNFTVNSGKPLLPEVVTGSLVTIVPLIIIFLLVQRYWRGGMLLGSIGG